MRAMPNLVLLICPSPWILDKNQTGVIPISRFCNKNCENSRTSNNINMKIGPIHKLAKKSTRNIRQWGDVENYESFFSNFVRVLSYANPKLEIYGSFVIKINLSLAKNKTKKLKKAVIFAEKMLNGRKMKNICLHLCTKFQVSLS